MSVRTEIDTEERLIRQYIEGDLNLVELRANIDMILSDARVTREYGTLSHIGDLTNALDEEQRREFAGSLRELGARGPIKVAVVCRRALNFATTKVFCDSADLGELQMRPFESESEALKWLREA